MWRKVPALTGVLAALGPAIGFIFLLSMTPTVLSGEIPRWAVEWFPAMDLSLALRLDPWSLMVALVVTGVGVPLLLYAGSYSHGDPRGGRMIGLLAAFAAAMLGLVMADHLLILYISWELTSVLSFLLVGYKHEKEEARLSARRALVLTVAGGLAMLAGCLTLARAGGSWYITELHMGGSLVDHVWAPAMIICFGLAALTKSAQFPFHVWLPGAMAAPTPVSCYLHAATMVKAGVFLLGVLLPIFGGHPVWFALFGGLGTVTAVWAGFRLLSQEDAKGLVAWSTVSALGTMVALLGLGTPKAALAVACYLPAHACYKATLFMVVGSLDHGTGTRSLVRLRGLRRTMPLTMVAAGLGAISLAGLPITAGFIGKEYLLKAVFEAPPWLLGGLLFAAIAGAVAAVALAVHPFRGEPNGELHPHESPRGMTWPALSLGLAGVVLGVATSFIAAFFGEAAEAVAGTYAKKPKTWPGTDLVLLLGLSLAAVGGVVGLYAASLRQKLGGLPIPPGDKVVDRMLDGLLTAAKWHTRVVVNGSLRSYMAVMVAIATGALITGLLLNGGEWSVLPWAHHLLDPVSLVLCVGGLIGVLVLRERIAVTIALGFLGAGVALVFLSRGAPDLALTQLTVEALTVLLIILAFRALPPLGERRRGMDGLWTAGLATIFGLTVIAALLTLTPEPGLGTTFNELSWTKGYGRNVVNVILVDIRALDTLGEISVLGLAALGCYAVMRQVRSTNP
jgi:multicomponent Na+:H+ antiporter subunit A